MPALKKITEHEYNMRAEVKPTIKTNCNPSILLLNGAKVQITDAYGSVTVKRGDYKDVVFIPNELLGEVRWNRVFKTKWNRQITMPNGVMFLFAA